VLVQHEDNELDSSHLSIIVTLNIDMTLEETTMHNMRNQFIFDNRKVLYFFLRIYRSCSL
jgi:hypothetical protein